MTANRFRVLILSAVALLCLLSTTRCFASEDSLAEKILELARDDDPRVRFQAALTIGEIELPERVDALAFIARSDASDPWVRRAILSSVGEAAVDFLETLIQTDNPGEGVDVLIAELSKLIGTKGRPEPIRRLLEALSGSAVLETIRSSGLEGLSEGLRLSGANVEGGDVLAQPLAELLASPSDGVRSSAVEIASKALPRNSPELENLIERQIEILRSDKEEPENQIQAAKTLRLGSIDRVFSPLTETLSGPSHDELQVAVLDTLSTFDHPEAVESIVDNWGVLGPLAKKRAVEILLSRNDRAIRLLAAIASEKMPANILASQDRALLLNYPNPEVAEKAKTLFAEIASGEDPALYRKYADSISLEGDREKGKKIYIERCAQCHVAEGEGTQLGPDWSALKSNTRETLLTSILYPNREVDPGFTNYILETSDGEIYTGVLAFSGPNSVILKRGGGQEDTLLRKNIEYLEDTKLSIMPTNLEAGLSTQDMADLLSFIETLQ